ncbi:hypothetical protein [Agrobacterium tumefaciens]|uniref:hypothetical protein n=1 Tax=Agrobacterium tumefaciens TaxID=358 RepID=UPI00097852C8|nr:hypothetical protein BV900_17045 [Agrobacterium tumefaciens]
MVASINSLSASAIPLLFGQTATTATSSAGSVKTLLGEASGNTDDVFKAGNAIGKIIEIVAGMNAAENAASVKMFTMDGAARVDGDDGEYNLTKTGTGIVGSDEQQFQDGLAVKRWRAQGTGPDAENAKAYLKAAAEGTIVETDLSAHGVSSTMTRTTSYYADGREKGTKETWNTTGLKEFLAANTFEGDDGMLRDKATGKYASMSQNGTKFTYLVY